MINTYSSGSYTFSFGLIVPEAFQGSQTYSIPQDETYNIDTQSNSTYYPTCATQSHIMPDTGHDIRRTPVEVRIAHLEYMVANICGIIERIMTAVDCGLPTKYKEEMLETQQLIKSMISRMEVSETHAIDRQASIDRLLQDKPEMQDLLKQTLQAVEDRMQAHEEKHDILQNGIKRSSLRMKRALEKNKESCYNENQSEENNES